MDIKRVLCRMVGKDMSLSLAGSMGNPTGTSSSSRPSEAATRSMIIDETSVFPIAASFGQSGRCPYR